jgi:hypothetical protein
MMRGRGGGRVDFVSFSFEWKALAPDIVGLTEYRSWLFGSFRCGYVVSIV